MHANDLHAVTKEIGNLTALEKLNLADNDLDTLPNELAKAPMKELFGIPVHKKDGTPGKKVEIPPVDELQSNPLTRDECSQATQV